MDIRRFAVWLLILLSMMIIWGCAVTDRGITGTGQTETKEVTAEVLDSVENLYSFQRSFANGMALLNIIPATMAEDVYDNYDQLVKNKVERLPILLREYAVTDTVYFDYDTDYSIVWDKNTGNIHIEPTDIPEREAFKQKQHK